MQAMRMCAYMVVGGERKTHLGKLNRAGQPCSLLGNKKDVRRASALGWTGLGHVPFRTSFPAFLPVDGHTNRAWVETEVSMKQLGLRGGDGSGCAAVFRFYGLHGKRASW